MIADVMLQHLVALRRRREQQALETLAVRAGLVREAERQVEEAKRETQRHLREARTKERDLIRSLAGRTVSHSVIIRAQTELDKAALETARLRAAAARAQAHLLNRQNIRAEASTDFQNRQRATARLDLICRRESARRSRWDAALDEVEDEDRSAAVFAGPPR